MVARRRAIVRTDRYETEKTNFAMAHDGLGETLFGIEHVLSRKPEDGEATNNPKIWAKPTKSWGIDPEYIIYYSFDSRSVFLESIQLAETDQEGI